jgi:hypothetical protein
LTAANRTIWAIEFLGNEFVQVDPNERLGEGIFTFQARRSRLRRMVLNPQLVAARELIFNSRTA